MAVPDLFFATRITSTAQQLGLAVSACAPAQLVERCRAEKPDLAIVDLHAHGVLDAVRALRADPATEAVVVVGFYSHVDSATREAAIAAGIANPMPRSAFTAKLAEILAG